MKLLIWNETNASSAEDNQIFLRLIEDTDSTRDVILAAVDRAGNCIEHGKIMIMPDDPKRGGSMMNGSLSPDIPIKTDFHGHLMFAKAHDIAMEMAIFSAGQMRVMVSDMAQSMNDERQETTH